MVDIIIPTHNGVEKLKKALGSIVAQTKKELIVTVVDDCTEDKEGIERLINNFKQLLPIRYIRLEENLKYPGLVRQVGLDRTNCDYVIFMDDDDMLLPYSVDALSKFIMKTDADMVLGAFLNETKNGEIIKKGQSDTTWLHGNIYKVKFLKDNNIRFAAYYNEDGGFNTQCYLLSDKIQYLDIPVYFWSYNKDSITRTDAFWILHNANHIVDSLVPAYQNIIKQSEGKDASKILHSLSNHFAFFYNIYNAMLTMEPQERETHKSFIKTLKNFAKEFDLNSQFQNLPFQGDFVNAISQYTILPIQTKEIALKDFFTMCGLTYSIDMTKLIQVNK